MPARSSRPGVFTVFVMLLSLIRSEAVNAAGEIIVCTTGDAECAAPDSFNTWLDLDLSAALNSGDVTLDTQVPGNGATENITFNPLVNVAWTTSTGLTLLAGNNVLLDGTINASLGTLNIVFGELAAGAFTLSPDASLGVPGFTATGGDFADTFDIASALTGDLNGGNGNDLFSLAGGSVSGVIDGGGDFDELIADNGVNDWVITATNEGSINAQDFSAIEFLTGGAGTDNFFIVGGVVAGGVDGGSGTDELVADDVDNTWVITAANAGSLNTQDFSDIENLTGGAAADTFVLAGGTISGGINGAGGMDVFDADNVDNSWLITGINAGEVNGQIFSGIENLTGGAQTDSFTIGAGGGLTGTASGGGGNDQFWLHPGGGVLSGSFFGDSGDDTFTLSGGGLFQGDIDGGNGEDIFVVISGTIGSPTTIR